MSGLLPTPLVLVAGVVAVMPLAFLARRPVPGLGLSVEAFITAVVVSAAFWLGSVVL